MSLRTRFDDVAAAIRGTALLAVEKLETGIVFNPMDPQLRSDPYPFYARLRRVDPFHRCRNADGSGASGFPRRERCRPARRARSRAAGRRRGTAGSSPPWSAGC